MKTLKKSQHLTNIVQQRLITDQHRTDDNILVPLKTLIKVPKNVHFLVKIHFGSSVSCKCNIYFGWSLEIQVIYIK
jgi:hypothetical protein